MPSDGRGGASSSLPLGLADPPGPRSGARLGDVPLAGLVALLVGPGPVDLTRHRAVPPYVSANPVTTPITPVVLWVSAFPVMTLITPVVFWVSAFPVMTPITPVVLWVSAFPVMTPITPVVFWVSAYPVTTPKTLVPPWVSETACCPRSHSRREICR